MEAEILFALMPDLMSSLLLISKVLLYWGIKSPLKTTEISEIVEEWN